MATSGTILSGRLHGTSEEGQTNGERSGGKAVLVALRQSEAGFIRHVLSLHYLHSPTLTSSRVPTFLSSFLRYVEQILQASVDPCSSTHDSSESELTKIILPVSNTLYSRIYFHAIVHTADAASFQYACFILDVSCTHKL